MQNICSTMDEASTPRHSHNRGRRYRGYEESSLFRKIERGKRADSNKWLCTAAEHAVHNDVLENGPGAPAEASKLSTTQR